ncbi:MAG: EthD family reductase [Candidatus Kapaibacterium sp.]|jgi:uncharacterized protein (TIGR02118 family)
MVSLTAFYKTSEDTTSFDAHYDDIHTPLVKQMEGLRKVEITRNAKMITPATSMLQETPHLICTMYFDDRAALDNSMRSPGGKAAAKDLMGFAGPLVSMVIGEVESITIA